MGSWNTDWSKTMPTTQAFKRKTSQGMPWTDWTAYNDAVNRYNAAQQEGQYQQGLNLYQQAAKLFQNNGAYDQSYNNAKNKHMASVSSDLVSRGLGNLVNTAGMDLAYEKEVRPEFEMTRLNQLSQALQNMAQYTGSYTPYQAQNMSYARTVNWSSGRSGRSGASGGGKSSAAQSLEKSPFSGVSFL